MHINPTLLEFAALLGLPSPCQQQFILEPAKSAFETWVPVAISFLQFCFLAWLTWHIFIRGASQKTGERQAAWYHKVVVDHSIAVMGEFFIASKDILCGCAERLPGLVGETTIKEFDQEVQHTIAKFVLELRLMRDDLSGRLLFFDPAITTSFLTRADRLEDDVTQWFDAYKKARPFDHRDSLPKLLIDCQNELLEIIRSFEFASWK